MASAVVALNLPFRKHISSTSYYYCHISLLPWIERSLARYQVSFTIPFNSTDSFSSLTPHEALAINMADEVSPVAELLGQAIYQFTLLKPLLPTYGHLLVSAIFPIYVGAHASLSRPSSAAKPPKKDKKKGGRETDDEDEDEEDQGSIPKMEGLEPSDAFMFPLTAGLTLGGLYLIIKWLGDPAILNKILSFYFSQMGLFFAAAFLKDALTVTRSFVLPTHYRQGGKIWKADQSKRVFITADDEVRHSPLPGIFGKFPLPGFVLTTLWVYRDFAYQRVKLRAHVRGLFDGKCRFGMLDVLSCIVGVSAVSYFAFVEKPWWLTNFLGFSFCYGALQFMSPSTFWTGTLILGSLFFYDIYFVFYTPLMVTVATKLDIPIKLLFPRPPTPSEPRDTTSLAMLGLGDIVIPGMMLGLALRFDLFLYYKRKGTQRAQNGVEQESVKPQYQSATGGWGERFWTGSSKPKGPELEPPYHDARSFPKTYFKASVVGYIAGMVTTLLVMQVFKHAQPALLYLVPGVLISLWATALCRGEVREMWEFFDGEEEEEEDKEKEGKVDDKKQEEQNKTGTKNGKSLFSRLLSGDLKALTSDTTDEKEMKKEDENVKGEKDASDTKESSEGDKKTESAETDKEDENGKDLDLVSISISLPGKSKSKKSQKTSSERAGSASGDDDQLATVVSEQDNEPPSKRLRRSPRTVNAS